MCTLLRTTKFDMGFDQFEDRRHCAILTVKTISDKAVFGKDRGEK